MVLKKLLAAEAVVTNWYKAFIPASAREVLEGIYLWATKNAERYEQFQNSITFMMLLFFTSRKIFLGLLGLVWVVLSFFLGSIWAAFSILLGSLWAAISFLGGLIWSAAPILLVTALVFYLVFLMWKEHALFLLKEIQFVFVGTAGCLGLLLLYRSASFSLLDKVYLIVMEILVVSVVYMMIKERIPEGHQTEKFPESFDRSNYHEIISGSDEANLQCTSPRVFKLNIDGIKRSSDGNLSAGGFLRDSDGKWFKGFLANFGKGDDHIKFEAELLGLIHGLQLAWYSDIRILELECDYKLANLIRTPRLLESHPLYSLHLNCKTLILRDWNCSIRHISRDKNKVACILANLGHDVGLGIHSLDCPPHSVLILIEADRCC